MWIRRSPVTRQSSSSGQPRADYSRAALLDRLQRETFDIVIIGGGITGAGFARDAALRGLSVALLEKGDFASGTSSRSSRLIHGGLRYLRYGHLGLVREALRERGLLLRLAPHLVRRVPFVLPVYEESGDTPVLLRLGLTGYDLLAGTLGIGRHRALSREKLLRDEPSLRGDRLRSGFRYFDAITDDARLTVTVILAAIRETAAAVNYAEVVGLERTGGRISGVHYRDLAGGGQGTVRARTVVSATGPWTDQTRSMAGSDAVLRPTKGVHAVVPRERLPTNGVVAFYWGNRPLFAVPYGRHTYIGTTDTDWNGDLNNVEADHEDVAYILDAANGNFDVHLSLDDVVATWAGVRPLLSEEGSPSGVSRDYEVLEGPAGMYAICGGKLTTFRSMAEHALDQVIEREGERFSARPARCTTATEPLPGATADFIRYQKAAVAAIRDGWGLPESAASRLVGTYGTEHVRVLAHAAREPDLLRPLAPGSPLLAAEAVYTASEEMAVTLEDFLRRRSDVMLFGDADNTPLAAEAARLMGRALGWSRSESRRQLAAYRESVSRLMAFRSGPQQPSVEAV